MLNKIYNHILTIVVTGAFVGCGDSGQTHHVSEKDSNVTVLASPTISDSLVSHYISTCQSDFVKIGKESFGGLSWMFDRGEQKNGETVKIYQIGHDVSDSGGTNPRFITDVWLYLDTVNRRIYEYEVAEDSLVFWSK